MKLTSINTLEDVKTFVHILIEEENLNFHPETPFEDYVLISNGQPFYAKEEAATRNMLLNEILQLGERLKVDTLEIMCDVGFDCLRKKLE